MHNLLTLIDHRVLMVLVGLLSGAILMLERGVRVSAQVVTGPGWSLTGSVNTSRQGHTATLLSNGKVLVVGGFTNCGSSYLSSAELYDPATGTWSYTGSLGSTRVYHSATLLPDGKVLVVGGEGKTDQYLKSAELYDPSTGTWTEATSPSSVYLGPTATLLANGQVLVVGDTLRAGISAELYDPVTNRWSATGSLNKIQSGGLATLLPGGKVLFLGGTGLNNSSRASAELFDPDTGRWSVVASLNTIDFARTITRLFNGKVLVTGSQAQSGPNDVSLYAEIYDPTSGTWSNTGAPSDQGIIVLIANGKVLSATGSFAQLYDPTTGRWVSTTSLNNPSHHFSAATLLSSGKVMCLPWNHCDNRSAALFDFDEAPSGTVANVSAASYSPTGLASECIAAAFDADLATTTSAASTLPLPTGLSGTTVKVRDSAGLERLAPLFNVSPSQINYQIPAGTSPGAAWVTVTGGDGVVSNGVAIIHAVAPGLFTANADGQGVAAALALRVRADGLQTFEPVERFDAEQNKFAARPIDLGPEGEEVYLVLFGTGIRHRSSLAAVKAWTWPTAETPGASLAVTFAGAQGELTGLDQVNARLPRVLSGRGEVGVFLIVDDHSSNTVRISIK